MAIDIGSIVEGTIVKLADYGAIVRLQGGKTGLIHISEIADTFVRDVNDYFKEQDIVRVKILNINNKGRYELSTKQVDQPEKTRKPSEPSPQVREQSKPAVRPKEFIDLGPDDPAGNTQKHVPHNFEDRLNMFIKESTDRQLDIKKNMESKFGSKKR